ncbi:MAG: signal peptidase II [Desulfobacteraceae bacterium 4572_87]|nr:MAG: signal peptidase II [Desulfobacteraceae bacterium 4572_87]
MIIWPALLIVCLDQAAKLAVQGSLNIYESVPIISGFFNMVHVRNRGMAFGFMNRPDMNYGFWVLVSATVLAIILLLFWFYRMEDESNWMTLGLSLILGGALGNLIDRIRLHEVIDFLDVYVGSYHWPAFNVADAAITVGALMVGLNLFLTSPEKKSGSSTDNR